MGTRSKAFRALVALVRQMPSLEEQFLKEKDGIDVIVSCADQSDMRLCEKAASFARSLVQDGRLNDKDVAVLSNALAPLVSNMAAGRSSIERRSHLASVRSPARCRKPAPWDSSLLGKKEEADDSEQANLQEFITLLSA